MQESADSLNISENLEHKSFMFSLFTDGTFSFNWAKWTVKSCTLVKFIFWAKICFFSAGNFGLPICSREMGWGSGGGVGDESGGGGGEAYSV